MTYAEAKYDQKTGLEMLYVSGLAYCEADLIIEKNCNRATKLTEELGMKVLHAKDNNKVKNTITYVILKRDNPNQLIISFSGTKNPIELTTEIAESYPIKYSIHPEVKGAKVHDYFLKHYMDVFQDDIKNLIPKILKDHPKHDIYFTGHSLGGAMTVHAAADFMLNGWGKNRNVYIYTYGQPRVGNVEFIEGFSSQLAGWYRLVHNKDLVAHIPPCLVGIKGTCLKNGPLPFYSYHAPQEIFYDRPFENYKECDTTEGEDPSCSHSVLCDSIKDHLVYFNLSVSGLHRPENAAQEIIEVTK